MKKSEKRLLEKNKLFNSNGSTLVLSIKPIYAEKIFGGSKTVELRKHIGSALSYVVNLVDPEMIVVGGSIANAYNLFIDNLKGSLLSMIYNKPAENLLIKQAEDSEINAIIGAATLFNKRR